MFLAPRSPSIPGQFPLRETTQPSNCCFSFLLLWLTTKKKNQKNTGFWASLEVQCLRLCTSAAGGVGSIPSQGLTKNLQTKNKNRGSPCILTGNQRNTSTFFCFPFLILLPLIRFSWLSSFKAVVGALSRGRGGNWHVQVCPRVAVSPSPQSLLQFPLLNLSFPLPRWWAHTTFLLSSNPSYFPSPHNPHHQW